MGVSVGGDGGLIVIDGVSSGGVLVSGASAAGDQVQESESGS